MLERQSEMNWRGAGNAEEHESLFSSHSRKSMG